MIVWRTAAAVVLLGIAIASIWPYFVGERDDGDNGSCPLGYTVGTRPAHTYSTPSLTIVYNTTAIYTSWPAHPRASAMLINTSSGEIVQLSDNAEKLRAAHPGAVLLNVNGRHVIPGLIDAHVHYILGGLVLQQLDVRGIRTKDALQHALRQHAATSKTSSTWIVGHGWDDILLGHLPDRTWIDDIIPDHPVMLTRMDGHMVVVNTRALTMAGLWPEGHDMGECGTVHMGEDGHPSGILTEACAIDLVANLVPEPSVTARRAAADAAGEYALSRGVTAVHDMGRYPWDALGSQPWGDLHDVYLPLARDGQLKTRVCAFMPLSTWEKLKTFIDTHTTNPAPRLYVGALKEFADGSLGSRTALFYHPYNDAADTDTHQHVQHTPTSSDTTHDNTHDTTQHTTTHDITQEGIVYGTRVTPIPTLEQWARGGHAAGLQVAVHAIGDRAVEEVGEMLGRVGGGGGGLKWRHRIEHAQHLASDATPAMLADAGIVAVTNPLHLVSDWRMMHARLGSTRAGPKRAYAFRSLLSAGVHQAFGSDWPVVGMDCIGAMHVAVHRVAPHGNDHHDDDDYGHMPVWAAEERTTAEEALLAHTAWAAEACSAGDARIGSLRPGYRADFVVLDGAPVAQGARDAPSNVAAVYMDGVLVWGAL